MVSNRKTPYKGNILHRLGSLPRRARRPLENFPSDSPRSIIIELSNSCNLCCKMCWYHGENGVGDKYRSTELTLTELCGFVDQLSGMKPKIYFGGSEPFIRPDFLAILKHVKDHNLRVAFATNGTLLDREKIETLVDLGVDDVKFSASKQLIFAADFLLKHQL